MEITENSVGLEASPKEEILTILEKERATDADSDNPEVANTRGKQSRRRHKIGRILNSSRENSVLIG